MTQLKKFSLIQDGKTIERKCGLKSEEKDCDASDGTCACDTKLCNKYIPLRCYRTDNSIMNCPAPPSGKTATCLTKRAGRKKYTFLMLPDDSTFDTEV